MYLWFAICAGIIGGLLSVLMRVELQEPGIQIFHGLANMVYGADMAQSRRRQAHVQCVRDGPRASHDLLHGHARHDRRLWQLVCAPHDRRTRHGLPAHEQHFLLAAHSSRWPVADFDVC